MPFLRLNATADDESGVRVSMPMNCTPLAAYSFETSLSAGASARHGGHHGPHRLITMVLPAKSAVDSGRPSRPSPSSLGAGLRSPTGTSVTSSFLLPSAPT